MMAYRWLAALTFCLCAGGTVEAQNNSPTTTIWSGVYTAAQAARGDVLVGDHCSSCHGLTLHGGDFGPSVVSLFWKHWDGGPLSNLYDYISTKMPADSPGSLGQDQYADLVARILNLMGVPPGDKELSADEKGLGQIKVEQNH